MYTFSNRCHEQDGLELGDETVKIFLNTKGTTGEIDEDVEKFLAYVDGKAAEGELAQDIAAEVERIKRHNETKVEYNKKSRESSGQFLRAICGFFHVPLCVSIVRTASRKRKG